jgi:hypothetical protein
MLSRTFFAALTLFVALTTLLGKLHILSNGQREGYFYRLRIVRITRCVHRLFFLLKIFKLRLILNNFCQRIEIFWGYCPQNVVIGDRWLPRAGKPCLQPTEKQATN